MKKYISAGMLAAKGSLLKCIGIMIAMAAAQAGVFYMSLNNALAERQAELDEQLLHPEYGTWDVPYPALQDVLDNGWLTISVVWIAAFILIMAVLGTAGAPLKANSQTRFTVQRLPIREWKLTAVYAIYNFAVLMIFWAFSIAMALVLCRMYYVLAGPEHYGSQTTFLIVYRNDLFHSLLPLAETTRYLRNVFLFLAVAVAAAFATFWSRRGKRNFWMIIAGAVAAVNFPEKMGASSSDWMIIALSIGVIGVMTWSLISQTMEGEEA